MALLNRILYKLCLVFVDELTHYMSDVRPHYVYTDALCCDKVQQTCDDLLNTHLQVQHHTLRIWLRVS